MAKVLAWLILIFLVLLALRIVSGRNLRIRQGGTGESGHPSPAEAMVRCVRCGVFVPRGEAKKTAEGYVCASGGCASHG